MMEKKNLLFAYVCCLVVFQSVSSQLHAQQLTADTLAKLDALFEHYGQYTPGASVMINRKGTLIYHRHFGMADLEHGVPITDSTRFEAGSVSKQFTATAILMLVNEGKISLDDPVNKYVTELPVYGRPITIRHLLNHTSGLKDWGSVAALGGWPRGSRVYTNDLALGYIIRQPDLNYLPGEEYLYSNSNYTLLTVIAERVSGQPLAEFTEERIFKPLGMHQTGWRTDFRNVVHGRAIGYRKGNEQYVMDMPFENTYGHAALLTSTHDLNLWNMSWKSGGFWDALLPLRIARGVLQSGDTITYAGGVFVHRQHRKDVVYHSGATAGYRAWLSYFPDEELSIAFLSNDAGAKTTATGKGLASIFLGEDPPATAPPREEVASFKPDVNLLTGLTGDYKSAAADGRLGIQLIDDIVYITVYPHGNNHMLKPLALDSFSNNSVGGFRFVRDRTGLVSGVFVSVDRARNVWFNKIPHRKDEEQHLPASQEIKPN